MINIYYLFKFRNLCNHSFPFSRGFLFHFIHPQIIIQIPRSTNNSLHHCQSIFIAIPVVIVIQWNVHHRQLLIIVYLQINSFHILTCMYSTIESVSLFITNVHTFENNIFLWKYCSQK